MFFYKYRQKAKRGLDNFLRRTKGVLRNSRGCVSAYWWTGLPNFGDIITPYILEESKVTPIFHTVPQAKLACIGSILEHLHSAGFQGTIFGTGFSRADSQVDISHCQIRATRGHLTRKRLNLPESLPVGDPGLLLRLLFKERQQKQYVLGLVPHFNDAAEPQLLEICKREPEKIKLIDVTAIRNGLVPILKQIDQCEYVISSSLHGLVVAEAFDIPTGWAVLTGETGTAGYHGTYKYDDYYSVFGIDREPITLTGEETLQELVQKTLPPPDRLPDVADNLLSAWNETLSLLLSGQPVAN
jgi:pyruvyltransferase